MAAATRFAGMKAVDRVASAGGRPRASAARLELFYDIVSPYSYLFFGALATLRYVPRASTRGGARAC
jgi:hypothetical protein